jgi:hypothetical protein
MAKSEAARQNGKFLLVCRRPDFCMTPMGSQMVPVPYMIVADLGKSANVSPNVRLAGDPAFLLTQSTITCVSGDEGGVGGGCQSGTSLGSCEPQQGSKTFRCNGSPVVREGDLFWMNNRNTDGQLVFQASAPPITLGADDEPPREDSPRSADAGVNCSLPGADTNVSDNENTQAVTAGTTTESDGARLEGAKIARPCNTTDDTSTGDQAAAFSSKNA